MQAALRDTYDSEARLSLDCGAGSQDQDNVRGAILLSHCYDLADMGIKRVRASQARKPTLSISNSIDNRNIVRSR